MPLQIRRGSTAQRLTITPLPGEILYDTTSGQIFVGDGTTVGGVVTVGVGLEEVRDSAASLFTTGVHSGISFSYNDELNRIDAAVTVESRGPFDGDLTGSVFSDDSTLLVDGTGGALVGPLKTSGLAGNLEVNGFAIVSSSNGNINISPNGTGRVLINGGLTITGSVNKTGTLLVNTTGGALQLGTSTTNVDGNLVIIRNSYSSSPLSGFLFAQHHSNQQAVNLTFYRTRGQGFATQQLVDGDEIAEFSFAGQGPGSTTPVGGAVLTIVVEGTPTVGNVPTKFQFGTNNGSSNEVRAELSSQGVWKVNAIEGLTNTLSVAGNLFGDVKGSVYADDSGRILDGTSGRITTPSVTLSEFLKLPVYADDLARDTAIPVPEKGMVIFIEAGTLPAATNQMQIHNGTNWISL
jgi:hypothetical protein